MKQIIYRCFASHAIKRKLKKSVLKIKKSIETPEGSVLFEGEINQDELDLILSVGLNFLLQQGAIPFRVSKQSELSRMVEGSDVEQ